MADVVVEAEVIVGEGVGGNSSRPWVVGAVLYLDDEGDSDGEGGHAVIGRGIEGFAVV